VEREVGVFAVDFGSGSGEDEFAFFAGGFEDALGAVDIGFDGADRAFDDELDADGSGEMDDDVSIIDEFGEELEIFDVVEVIFHLSGRLEVADVIHATGGVIVEQNYAVAAGKKTLRQMGTDKTGATGDQITQRASLQSQVIVVLPRGAFADRLRKFRFIAIVSGISRFLRAVTIRIGIVPIRIVIVRSAGIHRIQYDAEDVALHADEQVARAGEGFLGSFAAANDQENAIRLDRQDNRIGGGHDGRGIDDDEFEFGAQFGDGFGQFVRGEQVRWIGRKRASGNRGEIGDVRVRDGNQIEARNTGQIRAEASVFAAAEVEQTADAWFAQVGIDEDRFVTELGKSDGQVGGGGGFTFPRQRAGDEDNLWWPAGLREKERGTESAKRLRHLRLGQMLCNEFDAFVVTVR
jgi:hypothetical protein